MITTDLILLGFFDAEIEAEAETVTAPEERIYRIAADNRVFLIEAEDRVLVA